MRLLLIPFSFFIQGEEGEQGSPGEVGTQGPTVRKTHASNWHHFHFHFSIRDSNTCCTCLIFQGPQGLRGAMGMIGSKGEMVDSVTVPVTLTPRVHVVLTLRFSSTGHSRPRWRTGSPGCGRGHCEFIPLVMDAVTLCPCIYELTTQRRVISGGSGSARSDGRARACGWKGLMEALAWFQGVHKNKIWVQTLKKNPQKTVCFFCLSRVPKGRGESQVFQVQREKL